VKAPPLPGLAGWIMRLLPISELIVDPNWVPPEHPAADEGRVLDLDKAWHGLHFLLTGTAWDGEEPGCFLLAGGQEIGDDEADSRPRVLDANQVRRFSEFLSAISTQELQRRFDPARMNLLDISPEGIWAGDLAPDMPAFKYLSESFDDLRTFVGGAAEQSDAVIVQLG
jgi:hypothetical protein